MWVLPPHLAVDTGGCESSFTWVKWMLMKKSNLSDAPSEVHSFQFNFYMFLFPFHPTCLFYLFSTWNFSLCFPLLLSPSHIKCASISLWGLSHQRRLFTFSFPSPRGGLLNKTTKEKWQLDSFPSAYISLSSPSTFKHRVLVCCSCCSFVWLFLPVWICHMLLFMWTERQKWRQTACELSCCQLSDGPTSEGRFHGGLHHADEQLETLGVLGEAGGERCQGVGMSTQVLQGNPLTKVGLQREGKSRRQQLKGFVEVFILRVLTFWSTSVFSCGLYKDS